jgi:hypothetical protein
MCLPIEVHRACIVLRAPVVVVGAPHVPSAPAFSLQGNCPSKVKRGKSRLRQMLGKLADRGRWFCCTSFAAGGPCGELCQRANVDDVVNETQRCEVHCCDAPSAPAFSLQGKAKRGKSRLRQMLGKLADMGGDLHGTSFAAGGP